MKMSGIYPVAKLGDEILLVNEKDLPYMGKERGLEVKCAQVDLKNRKIYPILELEKYLKFNPWEETSDNERRVILEALNTKFSDTEILEKIIQPLDENLVKPPYNK